MSKHDIIQDEWYPVLIPSFLEEYGILFEHTNCMYEFTEEEIRIIKSAFLLFKSSQVIIKEKLNDKCDE